MINLEPPWICPSLVHCGALSGTAPSVWGPSTSRPWLRTWRRWQEPAGWAAGSDKPPRTEPLSAPASACRSSGGEVEEETTAASGKTQPLEESLENRATGRMPLEGCSQWKWDTNSVISPIPTTFLGKKKLFKSKSVKNKKCSHWSPDSKKTL